MEEIITNEVVTALDCMESYYSLRDRRHHKGGKVWEKLYDELIHNESEQTDILDAEEYAETEEECIEFEKKYNELRAEHDELEHRQELLQWYNENYRTIGELLSLMPNLRF